MKIKKNALLLAVSAIFFVSLILSCSKKTDSVSGEDLVPAEEEKFSLVVAKEKKTLRSLALYRDKEGNGAPLYVENKDGIMVYADSAICGDYIDVYLDDFSSPETVKAVRLLSKGKDEERDFVHVRYYEDDFWTLPAFISAHGNADKAAVISEDTFIYSSRDLVNAKTKKIEASYFVSVVDTTNIDNIKFAHVYYYDWNTLFGKEGFVKYSALSTAGSYVASAQVGLALNRTKDLKPYVESEVKHALEILNAER